MFSIDSIIYLSSSYYKFEIIYLIKIQYQIKNINPFSILNYFIVKSYNNGNIKIAAKEIFEILRQHL